MAKTQQDIERHGEQVRGPQQEETRKHGGAWGRQSSDEPPPYDPLQDDRDPEKLRYLAGLGLVPGTRLLVVNRQPFNGPTSVRVGQDLRVVGHELALSLLCREVAA